MSTSTNLTYDWETESNCNWDNVCLLDETLRDGLQSSMVRIPNIDQQREMLSIMNSIGIEHLDIGFPSSSKQAFETIKILLGDVTQDKMDIKIAAAGRTLESDIIPMLELQQQSGVEIEPLLFIGVSKIRQYVEGWSLESVRDKAYKALSFAIRNGVKPTLVIEDATRACPNTLKVLFEMAVELDIKTITICDTVGQSTPSSVRNLIGWCKDFFRNANHAVTLDWHGHNDRGLSIANSIEAINSGCKRVHGTALGVGERAGNTPIDSLIVNLMLFGKHFKDPELIMAYSTLASKYLGVDIPKNYPVIGDDVFRTSSGVHAAAIYKARKLDQLSIVDRIYSSVPATSFGLENTIDIGPMSGRANVQFWLDDQLLPYSEGFVDKVLATAKTRSCIMSEEEIWSYWNEFEGKYRVNEYN